MSTSTSEVLPAKIQSALHNAVRLHIFDPNVSLIDFGLRIRDREDYQVEPEPCIRVHVRQKLFGAAFDAFASRYPERVVDKEQIGFRVDVPQANYKTQQSPWWPWSPWTTPSPRAQVFVPMQGGISISNAMEFGFGTLGGKVIDRDNGKEMILSNWHVLAGSAHALPGLAIYQPGRGDGGSSFHTVARLTRHAMDQFIDAAVAELTGARELTSEQLGLGAVTGVRSPVLGMQVVKSGRKSGVTSGIITGVEGRQVITYKGVPRVVRHIAHIAQGPAGGQVSAGGDSGSWWLDKATHSAVGLHFAGNDQPEYALSISMPEVLDALNVDIVTAVQPEVSAMFPARVPMRV